MFGVNRETLYQPFSTFVVAVGTVPTPILPTQTKADLINAFYISLDAGAANNIFIGDQGVTIANGLEIVAGAGPVRIAIEDQRLIYEIMIPFMEWIRQQGCNPQPYAIPYMLWDMTQIYAIAAAATNIRVAVIRAQYI